MRMLGFNAIRLAFSFDDTWGLGQPPISWTATCPVPTNSVIEATLVPGTDAATTVKSDGDTVQAPHMRSFLAVSVANRKRQFLRPRSQAQRGRCNQLSW